MNLRSDFPPLNRAISPLVLGTVPFGSWTQRRVDELLDAWVDAGVNVVDCANSYGRGASEARVGSWLNRRRWRDDLVIITKGGNAVDGIQRLNPSALASDLEESRQRLGLSEIDIYMLHKDDPLVSPAPVLEWLNRTKASGVIKTFGASNWTTSRLECSLRISSSAGFDPISCSSPNLSLARQHTPPFSNTVSAGDPETRKWYTAMQLPLFAWSAQAGGFFTDARISGEPLDLDARIVRAYHTADNFERRARAIDLGRAKGVDANAIALAWVLHQPYPTFAIVGPQTPDEVSSCVAAAHVQLTVDEVAWLDDGAQNMRPVRTRESSNGVDKDSRMAAKRERGDRRHE